MQHPPLKPERGLRPIDVDLFFERHLMGVAARVEVLTQKALSRQRTAWRDSMHRQAALDARDFEWRDHDQAETK